MNKADIIELKASKPKRWKLQGHKPKPLDPLLREMANKKPRVKSSNPINRITTQVLCHNLIDYLLLAHRCPLDFFQNKDNIGLLPPGCRSESDLIKLFSNRANVVVEIYFRAVYENPKDKRDSTRARILGSEIYTSDDLRCTLTKTAIGRAIEYVIHEVEE